MGLKYERWRQHFKFIWSSTNILNETTHGIECTGFRQHILSEQEVLSAIERLQSADQRTMLDHEVHALSYVHALDTRLNMLLERQPAATTSILD